MTREDLYKVTTDARVERLLRRLTRDDLLEIIQRWFNQPDLKPDSSDASWEIYQEMQQKHKYKVIDRVLKVDWVNGLRALQIAQLDLKYAIDHPNVKRWQLWRLKPVNNDTPMQLALSLSKLEDHVQLYLSSFFRCHVYCARHPKHHTYWMRISFFETSSPDVMPLTTSNVYLIYYPMTEYILCGGTIRKNIYTYVVQALVSAFDAGSIKDEKLGSKKLEELNRVIDGKESLGIFDTYAKNQVDPNPLDIHQKVIKPDMPAYVSTAEEKRRIVPVDRNTINARYEQANALGIDPPAIESLSIQITMPPYLAPEGEDMTAKITLKGDNVMKGIQELITCGIMKLPLPEWLPEVAAAGINKVFLTRDGIFRQEGDDDEEE